VRAVRFARSGDPSVLQVDEVPAPRAPKGDEVLVEVGASSVNGTDLGLRRGDLRPVTLGRLPFTPGFDLAGTVVACGPAVTAFSPGDRVMALLSHGGGGLAEQVLLRQHRAAAVPSSVPDEQAAAIPLAGLTALQAVHGAAHLRGRPAPARVLVLGAAGGIGAFAVQLARLAGAHVTATARTAQHAFVAGLGADELLDHRTQDVTATGLRWDVVIDTPGRYTAEQLRPVLTADGVHVSTRALSPDALRSLVPRALRPAGPYFVAVRTRPVSQDLAHLAALVVASRITVPLDRSFPMEEAAQAHRWAEGPASGKVVIVLR